jgi:ubiquinone/menaquinone biosynthesis C-methylase UbiE
MLNNLWSQYVQTTEELYHSREMRFNDSNESLWLNAIGVKEGQNILEVGCAGGAFCHRIKQVVPNVKITGLDFDTAHIAYAKTKAAELGLSCQFVNGDATAMPFSDDTFDLCYSHTVMEHVPHGPFLGEQYRVLKKGGRIAALSVRSRLGVKDHYWDLTCEEEKSLLEKAWRGAGDYDKEHHIGAYEMDEHEYPKELERAGFHNVNVNFFTIVDYAPDNDDVSDKMATGQINNNRLGVLASMQKALNISPDALTEKERSRLLELINGRFDKRVEQYRNGEKLWDFSTKTMLVVTGSK